MKTSILTLFLALSLIAAPQRHARSQMQRLVDQLGLTSDQKGKIDPILEDEAKQLRTLRGDRSAEATHKKTEIRKATDAKVKALLTDEQWNKLKQLRAARKAERKKK